MDDEKPEIDLGRFKTHQRKFPWAFMRKLIIVAVLLSLFYYIKTEMKEKPSLNENNLNEGIEVEIELL